MTDGVLLAVDVADVAIITIQNCTDFLVGELKFDLGNYQERTGGSHCPGVNAPALLLLPIACKCMKSHIQQENGGPPITIFLLDHIDVATPSIPEISPATGFSSQSAGCLERAMAVMSALVFSIPNQLIFSPLENKLHLMMGLLDPITWVHHMTMWSKETFLGWSVGIKNAWAMGVPAGKK
ncbi:hypothetical protein DUI87_18207 [Hirundo rustica rustica]|uniref:Uncharacterized protein n=1 Tax=Hirundo rustica rustica TaxID=333673 RepID=A0A3M0JVJ4_HIRRU|nr:hypothetical protein DUI87_18207 [Hirundo rustica rustica]